MQVVCVVLAGDGFFVLQVMQYRLKSWVGKMLVPYFFFFVTSCLVTLYSIVVKVKVACTRVCVCVPIQDRIADPVSFSHHAHW